jgi:hypothetical protein
MNALKIIAYIAAAILIFFGVLFIWAAFGVTFNLSWLIAGIITIGVGFGLVFGGWLISRREAAAQAAQNVTLNIDLPSDVNLDTLKCQSCGGVLSPKDITMVAGAPVVTCPWCGTTYQLTEEPKW